MAALPSSRGEGRLPVALGRYGTTIVGDEVDQGDFVASARSAAAELQAGGAEVIIALTQITNDEARDVLNAVPAIDAAMTEEASGSSPVRIEYASGERPVVSPAADYGTVVRFRASLDEAAAVSVVPTILPVSENVAADPAWSKVQARYAAEMDAKLSEKVGAAAQDLSRPELGRIVAQAHREYAATDFGWQNGGGIRAELPAGTLTKRSVLSVLPFGNGLISITTTGAHIKDALEQAIESDPDGNRGFPRTAGLLYDVDLDKPAGERVSNLRDEAGRPLDPAARHDRRPARGPRRRGDAHAHPEHNTDGRGRHPRAVGLADARAEQCGSYGCADEPWRGYALGRSPARTRATGDGRPAARPARRRCLAHPRRRGGDHPRASALGQHRARQLAKPLTVLSTLWVNSPLIGPMEVEIDRSWRL
ncbi:5'-nucleotidase C-terminal domain-containing protein [Bowdeniella massiliensis]|uniref:5'-nucleotidase C-terminal domain-containing protein n=1 Tax=Bowdeniella massiliensis TaxID=2932264 RepID=UPI002028BE2F|nr:5'-nucleotidase C-terminal domain-containing protein [Bowdeniella massiliensis]